MFSFECCYLGLMFRFLMTVYLNFLPFVRSGSNCCFFACGYPVFSVPCTEKTIFSALNCCGIHVEDQPTPFAWGFILSSVGLHAFLCASTILLTIIALQETLKSASARALSPGLTGLRGLMHDKHMLYHKAMPAASVLQIGLIVVLWESTMNFRMDFPTSGLGSLDRSVRVVFALFSFEF